MEELRSILETWRANGQAVAGAVLATVVHVKGSAYRRPGARMLVLRDGQRIGTISGGCLEGDVARKAAWWTASTGVALRTFDTSDEGAAWDFGLGCNGVITLLLEQTDSADSQELLATLADWTSDDRAGVVATVIRANDDALCRVGERLFLDANGEAHGPLIDSGLAHGILPSMQDALDAETGCLLHLAQADVFVEWVGPAQRLVIFGAGHDAVPVAALARLLGWRVSVADSRPAYARSDRFPGAERVLVIPSSGDISHVPIDPGAAVVMMTHNYPQDQVLLPQILARQPRYLGMLGPRHRTERLFHETGQNLSAADVYAPVGLDLGADHPESIALSIVAEVQAVLANRRGGSLRFRRGSIHAPVRESGPRRVSRVQPQEFTIVGSCEARVTVPA